MNINRLLAGAAASVFSIGLSTASPAAVVVVDIGQSFASSPIRFSFLGGTFRFSSTGNIFAPTAVSTAGTGAFQTIFGNVTSYFPDRGTVIIGPGQQFASVPTATTVNFSNGGNLFGLRTTIGTDNYYGVAYTTNNTLNRFAFETTANTAINATAAAVPEPASWAMMIAGFGVVGAVLRRRRVAVTFGALPDERGAAVLSAVASLPCLAPAPRVPSRPRRSSGSTRRLR